MEEIRLLLDNERDELYRFLECAYGYKRGLALRNSPHLQPLITKCSLIMKSQESIVGNVSTYPLKLKVGPSTIPIGAISAVAVAPEARGRGYMSKLMKRSIEIMKENKIPLSVLWGDRQRYNHFGYETCGLKYQFKLNRRSLEQSGIEPAKIQEVDPCELWVSSKVSELHSKLQYRVERKFFDLFLTRPGVRVFLGKEGYLISWKESYGDLVVQEVISPIGREPELVLGSMDWTFGNKALVEVENISTPAQRRLYAAANSWTLSPQGMFRVIDWPGLVHALAPYFAQVAIDFPPFELCIGCSWLGEVQVATINWDGSSFMTIEGKETEQYIEIAAPYLVGTLLGGPFRTNNLGLFEKLLPVPVHIPSIDHV